MAKRKRDTKDHDSAARGRDTKKVKRRNLEEPREEVVEPSKLEAKALPCQDDAKERETKDDIGRDIKLARQERRRQGKAQEIASEAQQRSDEKEGNAIDSVNPIASQEPKQQKRKKKEKKQETNLVSGEMDDLSNDVITTVIQDSSRQKLKTVKPGGKNQQIVSKSNIIALSLPQKQKRKNKNKSKSTNGETHTEKPTWKVSDPVGGHMLDVDPIFSRDEKYLLVAYDTAITVYSTSTSLPVRRLMTNKSDRLSAFTLSSSIDSQVYICTIAGEIENWDWTGGSRLGRWKLSSSIYFLTISTQTAEEHSNQLIYTVDMKDADQWRISAHLLESGENATKTDVKTLLRHQDPLSSLKILAGGRFVVAASGSQLIIGHTTKPNPSMLQDLSYTWRIVECPEWITCIDARISHPEKVEKPSKGGRRRIEALDVAVGGLKGSIHVYDNLLGKLIRTEQPTSKELREDIKSRRLHWHRNAVLSLKWSLDGMHYPQQTLSPC